MSLFSKRKGRRIATHDDDDDDGSGDASAPRADDAAASSQPTPAVRFGKRPSKPSSLRRNVVLGDGGDGDSAEGTLPTERPGNSTSGNRPIPEKLSDSDDDDGPVVVRPTTSRTGSSRAKKRQPAAASVTSAADNGAMEGVVTPELARGPRRKVRAGAVSSSSSAASLAPRVLETNTFRKALSGALPSDMFFQDADDGARVGDDGNSADNERPRYSQAYLEELQSATPNRPRDLAQQDRGSSDVPDGADTMDMDLDPSELEGALVVDESELASAQNAAAVPLPVGVAPPSPTARVLTATEIQERKDRRARRALEQEAAALQLGSDDDEAIGYISLLPEDQKQKKRQQRKDETRLVREDEDLGEGFDQYVEDEQLAFGRKAERAARRQRKHDMAALINAAEADDGDAVAGGAGVGIGAGPEALARTGGKARGGDDSSDSEAERRAAYDAAQTRAGMGGGGMQARRLRTTAMDDGAGGGGSSRLPPDAAAALVVPKMSALPDLADCLARMQRTVQALADEAAAKRAKLAAVEREKAEIAAREAEVQAVLDAAAQKYQAVLGTKGGGAADGGAGGTAEGAAAAVRAMASGDSSHTQSPLRAALPPGFAGGFPAERGLESLGATPVRPKADDAEDML